MIETDYLNNDNLLKEKLEKIPTLSNFKIEHLQGMLKLSKIKEYEPGELIIEEDNYDNWVFFLVSGKVRVVKKGMDINTLDQTGDVFGEMGIIEGMARSASIYAIEETVCLATDASYMDRLSDNDKTVFTCVLYQLFSELLSHRLRSIDAELVQVKEENLKLKSKLDKFLREK